MNRALLACLFLLPLSLPATAQELPPPVELTSTEHMDPAVLALIAERVAVVKTANAAAQAAEGEAQAAARVAAGEAQAELGLAYEANTMFTPARNTYTNVISLLPDKPEWRYRLGICQVSIGDAQAALETFRAVAKELAGTSVVQARLGSTALLLGHIDEAEAAWQAALDAEAKLPNGMKFPESRVGLAQVRFEQGHLGQAESLLREALSMNSGYRHARYLLGQVLSEQGREEEAEFELTRGLNAWPSFPPDPHGPRLSAYSAGYGRRMMLVENMMQSGQIPAAMQALQVLNTERPEDHFVLNLMARGMSMQGQLDQAYAILQRSDKVNPLVQDTKIEMAINLINRSARSQDPVARGSMMQGASDHITAAIEIAPLRGRPWFYRGLIQLQTIDPNDQQAAQQTMQAATQSLQRAHMLGCREPQLYEQLAQVSANMGRTKDMVRFAREGARRTPDNPGSWMFLSRALLTIQEFDESLVALGRAEIVAAGNPQVAAQVADFATRMRAAVQQQREAAKQAPAPKPGGGQ
ncbi:MAG: tetratricopeptide (TPR) repeat protein [Planctomycetota bacterium]|jgi:tetratricopeptide (TPR) repeat protein